MKYFVTAALAVALMGAAAAAQAENPQDKEHRTEARPARAPAPRVERTAPRVERAAPRVERTAPRVERTAPRVERTAPRVERTAPRVERTAPRVERTAPRVERTRPAAVAARTTKGAHDYGFKSHALRPADKGRSYYSASRFQARYVAVRRFHFVGGGYPGGWYARAWVFGDVLPIGWYAPGFYLDYGNYGLPLPPIGCEWVREGPDAVLVDVWTGQVLSVYSGVFY
jgi:Ni/Co efflux regulator RcnB